MNFLSLTTRLDVRGLDLNFWSFRSAAGGLMCHCNWSPVRCLAVDLNCLRILKCNFKNVLVDVAHVFSFSGSPAPVSFTPFSSTCAFDAYWTILDVILALWFWRFFVCSRRSFCVARLIFGTLVGVSLWQWLLLSMWLSCFSFRFVCDSICLTPASLTLLESLVVFVSLSHFS